MGGRSRVTAIPVKALFQLHQNGALPPRNQAFTMAAVTGSEPHLARPIADDGAFARGISGFERPVIAEDAHNILVVIMHGRGLMRTPAVNPDRGAAVVKAVAGAGPRKGQRQA